MKYYSLCDKGKVRKTNQDSLGIFENQNKEKLFLVCDGVGGNNAGDIASSLTISKIGREFEKNKGFKSLTDARRFLKKIILLANNAVFLESQKDRKYNGMATTLTGLLFSERGILLINVGDSRVYCLKGNKLQQLSEDHSYVAELLRAKLISESEAKKHPKKHMITRAIGSNDIVEIDVKLVDERAEYFLICSDGLHGYVKESDICKIISGDGSVEKKTYDLMNAALDVGGPDNISIILIEGENKQ